MQSHCITNGLVEHCRRETGSWSEPWQQWCVGHCWKGTVKVTQSCRTLCDPMNDTVHGFMQARILEWVAFHFSRSPTLGLSGNSAGKESAWNAGDPGSIPGLGGSPGEGKGYPFQYCGLENSMDCIVHGVAKNRTRLSNFHCKGQCWATINCQIQSMVPLTEKCVWQFKELSFIWRL